LASALPGRFDADKLRRTRVAAGLSRHALAERIGANPSLVKSWETRGVKPTVRNLSRVADALGLAVNDLYQPDASSEGSLVDLRVAAGLSQRELAEQLGVSQATMTRWEGGRARPNWYDITRYAKALEVEPTTLAAAVGMTATRYDNAQFPQKMLEPKDFHVIPASPHVIYEFQDPSGHVTVTSPQFPQFVYRPKAPTPTMLELATICEHVEAGYRHRYNHLQSRCAGSAPNDSVYLIRWLSAPHDTPAGSPSPRTQRAESLRLTVPLWRAGQVPGPRHRLSTGEYLVIVVEPTDTAEFLANQIPPNEEVSFYPTQPGNGISPLAVTHGNRLDGILRSEVPPDATYHQLCQQFSVQTVKLASLNTPSEPDKSGESSGVIRNFSQTSPYDPYPRNEADRPHPM